MTDKLPPFAGLAIGVLAGIFRETTNSYKFLMFRTLLDLLRERNDGQHISYRELAAGMPAQAWCLIRKYRLSLGKQDRTHSVLDRLDIDASAVDQSPAAIRKLIADNPTLQRYVDGCTLMRFVPTRLLMPWFEGHDSVRGTLYERRDRAVEHLSRSQFDEVKPLYRIDGGGRAARTISMHPLWVEYFQANRGILEGWLNHKWLDYLQRRNPNVPMLSEKLWGLGRRLSLGRQRNFWRPAVADGLRCIYSDRLLDPDGFALDHFVPRLWIAHDQLWNLIPTTPEINSNKGARVPSAKLVSQLAEAHHKALAFDAASGGKGGSKNIEDYVAGLNLGFDELQDIGKLRGAYQQTVGPQMQLALRMGFEPWRPHHTPRLF